MDGLDASVTVEWHLPGFFQRHTVVAAHLAAGRLLALVLRLHELGVLNHPAMHED